MQLDLAQLDELGNFKRKEFHQDYQFNFRSTLQQFGKDLGAPELMKDSVYKQLSKGRELYVDIPGKGQYLVQANPGEKSLDFYQGGQLIDPKLIVPHPAPSEAEQVAKVIDLKKSKVTKEQKSYGQSIAG